MMTMTTIKITARGTPTATPVIHELSSSDTHNNQRFILPLWTAKYTHI